MLRGVVTPNRDAVISAALESVLQEQPTEWRVTSLSFVESLPRHEAPGVAELQKQQTVLAEETVGKFADMVKEDQQAFKMFLAQCGDSEASLAAHKHAAEMAHRSLGMAAADALTASSIHWEQ